MGLSYALDSTFSFLGNDMGAIKDDMLMKQVGSRMQLIAKELG